jgi:hypothetical protein
MRKKENGGDAKFSENTASNDLKFPINNNNTPQPKITGLQ